MFEGTPRQRAGCVLWAQFGIVEARLHGTNPSRYSRVAVVAEWTETIVSDHLTFEPGDRALERFWLDRLVLDRG